MTLTIEIARVVNDDLVNGMNRLLPQLSTNAVALTHTDVTRLVESPTTMLFVARSDGSMVGTLSLVVFAIPTGLRAWIEDVIVDESARGTGVGEALTLGAVNEARGRHVRSIDLTTRPAREAANRLYERLGFELRETNVYRFSVEPEIA